MGKLSVGLLFFIFLSTALIVADTSRDARSLATTEVQSLTPADYQTVDPIIIKNVYDMGNYSFPGTGTKNDPYIIENYSIKSLGFSNDTYAEIRDAISISSVPYYFIIRNNELTGGGSDIGIYLNDIVNATVLIEFNTISSIGDGVQSFNTQTIVQNNTFSDVEGGVHISGNNSLVQYNRFQRCSFQCISSYYSGSRISYNTISESHTGISVFDGGNVVISNNTIDNQNVDFGIGIEVLDGSSVEIFGNTIANGTLHGIFAQQASDLKIYENYIANYQNAQIDFRSVNDSIVFKNEIENSRSYGMRIDPPSGTSTPYISYRNSIYHNSFTKTKSYFSTVDSLGFDSGVDNVWYNTTTKEGNYWYDYSGKGSYDLAGDSGSQDLYPLNEPVVTYGTNQTTDHSLSGRSIDFINILIYALIIFGAYKLFTRSNKKKKQLPDNTAIPPTEMKAQPYNDQSPANEMKVQSQNDPSPPTGAFCSNCGSRLELGQNFCSKCGTRNS